MGLIKAGLGAMGGVLADQWRDYFYCSSLKENVLVVKGEKRISGRSSNYHGSNNIITSGSIVAVADGQCMIIVDQGRIAEVSAEPGEYVYDASSEPTFFAGKLSESSKPVFANMKRRFTFGGEAPKDQRVYYFNTKELTGNRFGTATPIPFRVVDSNIGLDMDVSITCFGTFSYRISNPLLFYKNVCGNVENPFVREQIDEQLETELLTKLSPALAAISHKGIRYSDLPAHTEEIALALNESLSQKWRDLRGVEVVSFGFKGVRAKEEDERMIKELQRNATFRNPAMAAAQLVGAQSAAMQAAAANEKAGPAMAFMGMNMAASAGGIQAENLFRMGFNQSQNLNNDPQSWTCQCGNKVTGNFCPNCGSKKPSQSSTWTCSCGSVNTGLFCSMCGSKRPPSQKVKCSNCGWESVGTDTPIRFCPNCGTAIKEE